MKSFKNLKTSLRRLAKPILAISTVTTAWIVIISEEVCATSNSFVMRDINNINLNKARKGKIYDTEFTERSVCAYATEKSVKFDCLSYELKSIIETITKNALNMNNASKNCMALMV